MEKIRELKSQAGLDKIEPKSRVVTCQKPARGTARKPAKKI
jgi:hypothetical protein